MDKREVMEIPPEKLEQMNAVLRLDSILHSFIGQGPFNYDATVKLSDEINNCLGRDEFSKIMFPYEMNGFFRLHGLNWRISPFVPSEFIADIHDGCLTLSRFNYRMRETEMIEFLNACVKYPYVHTDIIDEFTDVHKKVYGHIPVPNRMIGLVKTDYAIRNFEDISDVVSELLLGFKAVKNGSTIMIVPFKD